MSKTQSRVGVTVTNNCTPIHLNLTESLGAPGNEVFLSVDGITNTDDFWDDWTWQRTDLYTDPKVWNNVQTGGLSYTIGTDDTAVRVKFVRGGCTYYSNVSGFPETLFNVKTRYASLYKDIQTFIESSGPTKLDFAGATIVNTATGFFSTSVVNDNFVAATADPLEMSYSGYLTFEVALLTPQRMVIAAYVNNVLVPQSRQIVVVPSGADIQIPFSKTFMINTIAATNTIDLRFDATLGDITAVDTSVVIKAINYTTS